MKKFITILTIIFVSALSKNVNATLTVDDYIRFEMEGYEPTYNEITQDQTSYENWVSYINNKTDNSFELPSFSTISTLTENILSYAVGNYAYVSESVLSNLSDVFSLGSDIWDFMVFNVQQMAFDYLPDFYNLLIGEVDEEIYEYPTSDRIGNWLPLPQTYKFSGSSNNYDMSNRNATCYVSLVDTSVSGSGARYSIIVAYKGVQVSSPSYFVRWVGDKTCNLFYNGTLDSGYYNVEYSSAKWSINGLADYYSSVASALEDFFGNDNSGEPILNGGIIVNDNPTIAPLTLPSAIYYPYKQTTINNYNDNNNEPINPSIPQYIPYNNTYKQLYWNGKDIEYMEFPEVGAMPDVELNEIEIDENVDRMLEMLEGSWIIEFLLIAILFLIVGLIL